jgi:hypothetical protein
MTDKPDFHEEMERFEGHMPEWAGRNLLKRLRHPKAVWVRVPTGIALTGGGVFSVLPGLGLWMLPVGLALLAHDVPPMRKPLARVLRFTNVKIEERQVRRAQQAEAAAARAEVAKARAASWEARKAAARAAAAAKRASKAAPPKPAAKTTAAKPSPKP